ncbi:EthD family reductase [Pseudonocardia sp. KRD-184]|uniref:EthD family reductase n=1 Tax=Pseudonocardia oceani TaxID=2792013 RepID=A0ABS6UF35_9PSEU|nr:EthD family reductase [Pseudonocardia oceani]MBW0089154.1 EthD family reductase [Pseudonocardia oceani]MBW0096099.1 EthD family reductase [Pseudonocardia oceani]MBW0109607.1 EthD family reductase [Pseudonocardia oceani]MBW0120943.1 EthD family reductase [Pseudonocardia oceani]MBW0130850.1 EthD family reductase [Pseudonocardia oceani]
MIKLTVLYDTPADVEAFDAHYLGTHVPLAQAVPGIEKVEVTRFLPGPDGSAPRFHIMAELYFADADAMGAALATPEGKELGADVANLGGTTATHLVGTVA